MLDFAVGGISALSFWGVSYGFGGGFREGRGGRGRPVVEAASRERPDAPPLLRTGRCADAGAGVADGADADVVTGTLELGAGADADATVVTIGGSVTDAAGTSARAGPRLAPPDGEADAARDRRRGEADEQRRHPSARRAAPPPCRPAAPEGSARTGEIPAEGWVALLRAGVGAGSTTWGGAPSVGERLRHGRRRRAPPCAASSASSKGRTSFGIAETPSRLATDGSSASLARTSARRSSIAAPARIFHGGRDLHVAGEQLRCARGALQRRSHRGCVLEALRRATSRAHRRRSHRAPYRAPAPSSRSARARG